MVLLVIGVPLCVVAAVASFLADALTVLALVFVVVDILVLDVHSRPNGIYSPMQVPIVLDNFHHSKLQVLSPLQNT